MTDLMLNPDRTAIEMQYLRGRLRGSLSTPDDRDWDEARLPWNLAVDQRPVAVVHAEHADDVAATVHFAREHGLRIAPQGTGHGAGSLPALDDAILLKTSRMRGVDVDPAARRVRVEAGVVWQEVLDAVQPYGLTALAGSSHDVGVVGYALGGGMGFLARKHGLAANSVTALEVVTADGSHVRADDAHAPDLYWALRGGGGSFGVVTALELELFPVRNVYAGVLFYPLERAAEVLHAWRAWTERVPDGMTSIGRVLRFPPIPDLPEHLSGKSYVVVEAAYAGPAEVALGLMAPLRSLGPVIDTVDLIPARRLTELHMDPPGPAPGVVDGAFLDELPIAALEAMLDLVGPEAETPLLSLEIRHLGGALARPSGRHGAVGTIDAKYVVHPIGIAPSAEAAAAARAANDEVLAAITPWESERTYFNFAERAPAEKLYPAATLARLREIKRRVDPGRLFAAGHAIEPAR